jgi:hypothetical protein
MAHIIEQIERSERNAARVLRAYASPYAVARVFYCGAGQAP